MPYDPYRPNAGKVFFDVTQSVDNILLSVSPYVRRKLTQEELDRPAFKEKTVTQLILRCVTQGQLVRSWPVRVLPRGRGPITCQDVFHAIYDFFRKNVASDELERIHPREMEACKRAMRDRCRKAPGLDLVEERKGMRRSDLLKEFIYFGGLQNSAPGEPLLLDFVPEQELYSP
jgi:hypothetical protein